MNRKRSLIAIVLIILILSGCITIKKYKVVLPAQWVGMENMTPDVYIDPAMDAQQRWQLLVAIEEARLKILEIWGSIAAQPEIYACSTETCFRSFGGSTNRANAIGDSKILLSPRALNSSMISHEWSHSELYQRVGSFFIWMDIPNWFDEGIAVMVSEDVMHGEDVWLKSKKSGIVPPDLDDLATHHDWIAAVKKYRNPEINPEDLSVVYATAGHEIRKWYKKAGQRGLFHVIEKVKNGAPFGKAYNEALSMR